MRFSLVMGTKGRTEEVDACIRSLLRQSANIELIVVDQNQDDRLRPVLARFSDNLSIIHLTSTVTRVSHARNLGIRAASGDVIGFPDDDCVYPDGLLAAVEKTFSGTPSPDVVAGVAITPSGQLGSGRWRQARGTISINSVWTSVIAFNLFMRAGLVRELHGFDERLGVGAPFGACEETDLVIRAIARGARATFEPEIAVVHPDKSLTSVAIARAFSYGAGMGFVMRKHNVGPAIWLVYLARPLGGAILSLARLRTAPAQYYWNTLKGRAYGLLASASHPEAARSR